LLKWFSWLDKKVTFSQSSNLKQDNILLNNEIISPISNTNIKLEVTDIFSKFKRKTQEPIIIEPEHKQETNYIERVDGAEPGGGGGITCGLRRGGGQVGVLAGGGLYYYKHIII